MTDIRLIDTHCHIDFKDFDMDRAEVIARAHARSVLDIIVPSVAKSNWLTTVSVCQRYRACHLALGMHPIFIEQHQPHHLQELDELVGKHSPLAIGEIGLDFYDKNLDQEKQLLYFDKQLMIAEQRQLPIIVHNRKAHDQCLQLLASRKIKGGIIHAFNGSIEQAHRYNALGFYLGFGGMITYPRSRKLRALIKELPLSSIVLETDSPDMAIQQFNGSRNCPEYIVEIAQTVAEIKNCSIQELATQTNHNANKLFKLFESSA